MLSSLLFWSAALAQSTVVLRNDTNYNDYYQSPDTVAWLDYYGGDCAISVLEPEEQDLPLDIHTVQVLLSSANGGSTDVGTEVHIQVLGDNEDPSVGSIDWGPMLYYMRSSSSAINELYLDVPEEGLYSIYLESGKIAVWICPIDPVTGFGWPSNTGIMIDWESPSNNNWLHMNSTGVIPLSSAGAHGSWIIRADAVSYGGTVDTGDTGIEDTGDTGEITEDTGEPQEDTGKVIESNDPQEIVVIIREDRGCGCETPSGAKPLFFIVLAALFVIAISRRIEEGEH